MRPFEQNRPAAPKPSRAIAGNVTRSDVTGVWVTPLGGDESHPSGPCRGAWHDVLVPEGTSVRLQQARLPLGARVLFLVADDGPWVISWEV